MTNEPSRQHYSALRKQHIMDIRSELGIKKKLHTPPYQSFYVAYELPEDDMHVPKEMERQGAPIYQSQTTVHQFTPIEFTTSRRDPWRFMSMSDVHGNSSASYRQTNQCYSAKIKNRSNNTDYFRQW